LSILALRARGLVLPTLHAFTVSAFRRLGVHVVDLPVPRDHEEWRALREGVARTRLEAVFTLDLGREPSFIRRVTELQAALVVPWLIWFVDDPEGYGFPDACDPARTLAFCWDRSIVEESRAWAGRPMKHLPLAVEPSRFYPVSSRAGPFTPGGVFVGSTAHSNALVEDVLRTTPGLASTARDLWEIYRRDLDQSLHALAWDRAATQAHRPAEDIGRDPLWRLWVLGCVREVGIRKRVEIVREVLTPGGAVFGDAGWRGSIPPGMYRGSVTYGEALREVYAQSGFVLDVKQPQSRSGLSQRAFDASACGVPVVAEFSREMEFSFEPDEEILTFRNVEEAKEARDRCLGDPAASRTRSRRARRRVLAHHTFVHRARDMLAALARRST
jgi:spore maturation protein CgeB